MSNMLETLPRQATVVICRNTVQIRKWEGEAGCVCWAGAGILWA